MADATEKEIECTVYGKVQGVGFREFVRDYALGLGIAGSAANNEDGTVTVVAQGEEKALKSLVAEIKKGPFFAQVREVDVEWFDSPQDSIAGFEIG